MKRRNNRFLAGTLAGLMMLTMLPVTALAAEEGAADETTTLTTTDGTPVPGASDNGIENVVNDTGDSQDTVDTGANAAANDTGDANPIAGNDGDKTGTSVGGNDVQTGASGNEGEGSSAETGGEQGGAGNSENGNTPAPAPAETFTAKIGDTKYETLDAAINAAQDGDTIEIGENCTLTVGTIKKAVVINGNSNTITIPEQGTENHALNINASLTFNKANVVFTNDIDNVNQWSVTMNSDGVLTLDEGSTCTIETHGIYASPNAVINVYGGSGFEGAYSSEHNLYGNDG